MFIAGTRSLTANFLLISSALSSFSKTILEHETELSDSSQKPISIYSTQKFAPRILINTLNIFLSRFRPSKKNNLVSVPARPLKKLPTQLFFYFLFYINTLEIFYSEIICPLLYKLTNTYNRRYICQQLTSAGV
jgi:hypothetical protein